MIWRGALLLALLATPGWSTPAPPDSVHVAASNGFLTFSWSAVEGAAGYRIYRQLTVHFTDRTEVRWLEWAYVDQADGIVEVSVGVLEELKGDLGVFAVASVAEIDGEEVESELRTVRVLLFTSVQPAGWGALKRRMNRPR